MPQNVSNYEKRGIEIQMMTKSYKIFSRAYRIILGLFTVFFMMMCSFFSGFVENDNSAIWLLVYSLLTITAITTFHHLSDDTKYKIYIKILICALVLASLAFVLFLLFSVLQNGDGNLLISLVLWIALFINGILLFYILQDKKYNHNG